MMDRNGAGATPAAEMTDSGDDGMEHLASLFKKDIGEGAEAEAPAAAPSQAQPVTEEAAAEDVAATEEESEAPSVPDWVPEGHRNTFAALPPEVQSAVQESVEAERRALAELQAHGQRALEAQRQHAQRVRDMHAQALSALAGQDLQPPDPELAESDPFEYTQQFARYQAALAHRNEAHAQLAQLQQARELENRQAMANYTRQVAADLPRVFPELADPVKGPVLAEKLTAYAAKQGVPVEALGRASAHELSILDKARRWDEAQGAAKAAQRPQAVPPKAARPGNIQANVAAKKTRIDNLKAQTRQNGSVASLAALFKETDF